jgi:hypothetical protein
MLEFVNKESYGDDRSHVGPAKAYSYSNTPHKWEIDYTGKTGQIYKEDWESNYATYHESLHFLGLSDRYNRSGNPDLYFGNDIMGRNGSYNIGDTHYQTWLIYGKTLNALYPKEKTFLSTMFLDTYFSNGKLYPATEEQKKQNP